MSIPPQIIERACRRVEKKSGRNLPFSLRGITINRGLIKAVMNVLNDSPEKTLPQNCRNDIRVRTPKGLDRRIKDYLDTDLRTANIISDVLAEAGVVEVVSVVNPETGRRVKGTRLLEDWFWTEGTENHFTKQTTTPIDYLTQVSTQRTKPPKNSVLGPLSKEEYLKKPDVKKFINWLEEQLDIPGTFKHQYYLVKAHRDWRCSCLYEAYENYWWPYNMACPIQGKRVSGTGFRESFKHMNQLAEVLRNAVRNKDAGLVRKSTLAMLAWGGVLNRNRDRIISMGDEVCDYFMQVENRLNLNAVCLGKQEGIFINSGFTKLYFLLVDDFIMYDGRVGAALGLLGRLYAEEMSLAKIPETIEFSFGSGKVSAAQLKAGNRRNPSHGKYRLPEFSGNHYRHLNDNIKASWLLKGLADRTTSRFALLPQVPPLNERLTAIQSALFMIGYDVISDRI